LRNDKALGVLDKAKKESDMNLPGWRWHPLKGQEAGRWAVQVNGNWRLTHAFENGDAILNDYKIARIKMEQKESVTA
jgi:toxin HigB-1